jgi:hypothetical protein
MYQKGQWDGGSYEWFEWSTQIQDLAVSAFPTRPSFSFPPPIAFGLASFKRQHLNGWNSAFFVAIIETT